MIRIGKTFAFSAAHRLDQLEPEHPCHRLHGHNYTVTLILEGLRPAYATGMLLDYRDLDAVKRVLDEEYDHRYLNDLPAFARNRIPTTAENIAIDLYTRFVAQYPALVAVRVQESEKTFAEYWA